MSQTLLFIIMIILFFVNIQIIWITYHMKIAIDAAAIK